MKNNIFKTDKKKSGQTFEAIPRIPAYELNLSPYLSETSEINLKYLVELYNLEAERMNQKVVKIAKAD